MAARDTAPDQPSQRQKIVLVIMAALALGSLALEWAWISYRQFETIPFSQFEQLVGDGLVTEVTVGSDTIQGKVKDKQFTAIIEFLKSIGK